MRYGLYRLGIKKGKKIIPTDRPIELWGSDPHNLKDNLGNDYYMTKQLVGSIFVVIKKLEEKDENRN